MSEWKVEVIRIGEMTKHPNADTLSITKVHDGYPVILRTEDWSEGDLAFYIPVDSLVPHNETFEFLFPSDKLDRRFERVRAKKLRGIFSMGLCVPVLDPRWEVGELADEWLGITKWEPPDPSTTDDSMAIADPGTLSVYDIEGLRRYSHIFAEGEEVIVTEKIHGANGRWFVHPESEVFYAGGRTQYHQREGVNSKGDPIKTVWWTIAERYELELKLNGLKQQVALYGEVYGKVQNLKYGLGDQLGVAFFDARDLQTREWLNYEEFCFLTDRLELPRVPELYRGPFSLEKAYELAEGLSLIPGADHVREGCVVRPVVEGWDPEIQRRIVKLHGEGYLTHKNA